MCEYTPPVMLNSGEKVEDLLMHYGTTERFSVKLYEDACKDIKVSSLAGGDELSDQNTFERTPYPDK